LVFNNTEYKWWYVVRHVVLNIWKDQNVLMKVLQSFPTSGTTAQHIIASQNIAVFRVKEFVTVVDM